MTTFTSFQPTATAPQQFNATLDGDPYTILVTWELFDQRYYINVHDQTNTLVVCEPVIGSPTPLDLAPPPAAEPIASMIWSSTGGGRVFFVMASPSTVVLGDTIDVSGATNTGTAGDGAVNGNFVVDQWTDSEHFSAALTAPTGAIGTIGGLPQINLESHAMTWAFGIVTANTAAPITPLMFDLGDVVKLTIANAIPSGYNGAYLCVVTGPSEFRFQLANDPGGPTTQSGTFSPDVNMVGAYFTTSSLVYRTDAQRFEVTP